MQILYLDFDGVLHPDSVYFERENGVVLRDAPGHELFEHANVLESILEPFPDVRIVLSTSWVSALGFDAAKERLSSVLQKRVIGSTFDPESMHVGAFSLLGRGLQVSEDLLLRRPTSWAAIDDSDEWWSDDHRRQLVLTDGKLGLGDERKQHELTQLLVQLTKKRA